jgi:hypothetical protein
VLPFAILVAACSTTTSGRAKNLASHQEIMTAISMSKAFIARVKYLTSVACARNSYIGWGTITPQPERGTMVNPAIMSAFIGGE